VGYKFCTSGDLLPVDVDEAQISQVISNIIINAVQAVPYGGAITIKGENVHLDPDVPHVAGLFNEGQYVKVLITDQGVGIPEENLVKIFDPFFTTKPTGSGLGLATSYFIVKNHNGHIRVQSEVGIGTTFAIILPAAT